MFLVRDIRETRIYQEAFEEGFKEGFKEGFEEEIKIGIAIVRLAAKKKSAAEIAALLKVDVDLVNRVLAQIDRD